MISKITEEDSASSNTGIIQKGGDDIQILNDNGKSIDSIQRAEVEKNGDQKKKKKHPDFTNRAAKWVPNDISEECRICKSYFNLVRRRHHCRNCGK